MQKYEREFIFMFFVGWLPRRGMGGPALSERTGSVSRDVKGAGCGMWRRRRRCGPEPLRGGAAVLDYMERHSLVRIRDLRAAGVNPILFWLNRGKRVAPGVWAPREWPILQTAVAAKRVLRGVVCLQSALFLHGLATEPEQAWIAIGEHARKPSFTEPPVRTVRFSGRAFDDGIEEHCVLGVQVRLYGVAKTVADLFKYRNKVGHPLAVFALRDALLTGRCSELQIWHWAGVCRVAPVVAPYLQVMRRHLASRPIPEPPERTPFSTPFAYGQDGVPLWSAFR